MDELGFSDGKCVGEAVIRIDNQDGFTSIYEGIGHFSAYATVPANDVVILHFPDLKYALPPAKSLTGYQKGCPARG